jgi:hypothetical protein
MALKGNCKIANHILERYVYSCMWYTFPSLVNEEQGRQVH